MGYSKFYMIIFLILLSGCKKQTDLKQLEFDSFFISVPNSWNKIKLKGIDSESSAIVTNNNDTIRIDYGKNNFQLYETVTIMNVSEKKSIDSLGLKEDEIIFSKTPSLDRDIGIYLNEYYKKIEINNKEGILRIPKNSGKGLTGLLLNNINNLNKGLTIYSKDLKEIDERELLESFNTIVFKGSNSN